MKTTICDQQTIKMNLTLPKDLYDVLVKKSNREYIKVSTYTRQFLMKSILTNKEEIKTPNDHEK